MQLRNKDVLYTSNAQTVEVAKALQFFRLVVATVNDPIVTATQRLRPEERGPVGWRDIGYGQQLLPDRMRRSGHEVRMAILRGPNTVAAAVLFFVVALSPMPLGSTSPVVIASWCAMLGIAVMTLNLRAAQASHLWLLGGFGFVVVAYAVCGSRATQSSFLVLQALRLGGRAASATLDEPLSGKSVHRPQSSLVHARIAASCVSRALQQSGDLHRSCVGPRD